MQAPGRSTSDSRALAAAARRLNGGVRLPALWFFTDPGRTPDPVRIALTLPRGAAVVYRHFGARDRVEIASRLAATARRRGLVLLIGADWRLAALVRADGVHLPERLSHLAASLRKRRPDWLVTAAAHGQAGLRRAKAAHAAVLSPVFPSRSASAGRALGVRRAEALARCAPVPAIALGGVTAARARALRAFVGLAAVDALAQA